MKRWSYLFIVGVFLTIISNPVMANSITDYLHVSGDLRSYYFSRSFTKAPNQFTFSMGGAINLETVPMFDYFQIKTTVYTAQPMGLNNDDPVFTDATLPAKSVTTLGQAFLQYKNSGLLIRAGDQLIDTPWVGPSDSRMIPATYQGIYSAYSPFKHWVFTALRVTAFKSRTSSSFSRTNLYNAVNIGGIPLTRLGNRTDRGVLAFGTAYKNNALNSEVWYYQFYDFAKLFYANNTYVFNASAALKPIIGFQLLRETGDGNNLISQATHRSPDADAIGILMGAQNTRMRVTLAYNKVFTKKNAFANGDIISPYSAGYATDPLYTTQMLGGLIEKSAGDAVKFSATYFAFNQQLDATISYAKYYTRPRVSNTDEGDLDVTYNFSGDLKGFSLRNRLGVLNGVQKTGQQINDRIMVQYNF